jgi:hypothetical protein
MKKLLTCKCCNLNHEWKRGENWTELCVPCFTNKCENIKVKDKIFKELDNRYSVIFEAWSEKGFVLDLEKSFKNFIKFALELQLEEIEKSLPPEDEGYFSMGCEEDARIGGYNQYRDEVLEILKKHL